MTDCKKWEDFTMARFDISFFSQSLNRAVRISALMPTDQGAYLEKKEKAPFPTLYLLHGMTGSRDNWVETEALWKIADQYHIAIILPSGENSFYCDSETTGRNFSTFVGQELVEFTRNTFPLSRKREETFIGGFSMGGFGAFINGLRYPETFGCITAFSAALIKKLILRADDEPGLDFFTKIQYESMFGLKQIQDFDGCDCDYETLAKQLADSGKEKPKIYMDCGTEDVSLYAANVKYKDELIALGYDVTWNSRPGRHDAAFWNDSLYCTAKFLPIERLEYAPDSELLRRQMRISEAQTRKMTE